MLRIEALPAACGDCLWIEYGEALAPHRILIDGGIKKTADVLAARIERAKIDQNVQEICIDLLVVTHIDNDHIGGVLELLRRRNLPVRFGEIWFNGRPQLSNLLGFVQGEALSDLLEQSRIGWNDEFFGRAIAVEAEGQLPSVERHGLRLTVLAPLRSRLSTLWEKWEEVVGSETRESAPTERGDLLGDEWPPVWDDVEKKDSSIANGSSIALLLEHGGRRLLLAGDAYASDLSAAIDRLPNSMRVDGKLPLDAFKLSHHGSASNLTRELLEKLACASYIVSTDGSVHHHPDGSALLRILRYSQMKPCLMFNYETLATERWEARKRDVLNKIGTDYDTSYPTRVGEGIVLFWI